MRKGNISMPESGLGRYLLLFIIVFLLVGTIAFYITQNNKSKNNKNMQDQVQEIFDAYCKGNYPGQNTSIDQDSLPYLDKNVYEYIRIKTSKSTPDSYNKKITALYREIFSKAKYEVLDPVIKDGRYYVPVKITTFPVFEGVPKQIEQAYQNYAASLGKKPGENLPDNSKIQLLNLYYDSLYKKLQTTLYRKEETFYIEYYLEADRARHFRQMDTEYHSNLIASDVEKGLAKLFGEQLPLSYHFDY